MFGASYRPLLGVVGIRVTTAVGGNWTIPTPPPYPHPERLRKYKQRTVKRWEKRWRVAHPPYQEPAFYMVGDEIWCNPRDLEFLKEVLNKHGISHYATY